MIRRHRPRETKLEERVLSLDSDNQKLTKLLEAKIFEINRLKLIKLDLINIIDTVRQVVDNKMVISSLGKDVPPHSASYALGASRAYAEVTYVLRQAYSYLRALNKAGY